MAFANPFSSFAFGELFDTVLPDFVLAFAFFTAICYAVLSRRFGEQRPAVAMSAALGMALAVGLVWWEYSKGVSIRNLGPIAAGFAVIVLAGVIYQSVRGIGGSWAGAGIAVGASLLVGWTLGLDWYADKGMIQSAITVALTVGILAFLLHRRGQAARLPSGIGWSEAADVRHDMTDLYQDERVSRGLARSLKQMRREARQVRKDPENHRAEAADIILQLQRILPAEGYLTERMARLRERAHKVRQGEAARIAEIQEHMAQLPAEAKRKAAGELAARYKELNLDQRLERLDRAVAENELRIRNLTRKAQGYQNAGDYRSLAGVLDQASKLQRHNAHLFKLIDGAEARLMTAARQAVRLTPEVNKP